MVNSGYMKRNYLNYLLVIYILFCFVTLSGVIWGPFTFGYGLGDITMLFLQALSVALLLIFKPLKKEAEPDNGVSNLIVFLIIFSLMSYFTLCLTVYRGPENLW